MEGSASAEAYPMQGGDGSSSYAKNSAYQKWVVDGAKPMILDAIAEHLSLGSDPSKIVITDLGCSTGPNTFFSVENIIEALELKLYRDLPQHDLEFQVFFNDHVANDFNILFKTLPRPAKYYAAGLPGSFHGRLFPESTIHVAHSSYSLHWLSRVPSEILDSSSLAWNKDRIFWPGKEKEVIESYLSQYKKDMGAFLDARAKEVVSGGLVMLSFIVRPNGVLETHQTAFYSLLGTCLKDMASEGIFAEEKVDNFNLPIYFPTIGEVEEILNQNDSFCVKKLEPMPTPVDMGAITSHHVTGALLAAMGAIIEEHFGRDIVENVRPRFMAKLEQNQHLLNKDDRHVDLFILLKRRDR